MVREFPKRPIRYSLLNRDGKYLYWGTGLIVSDTPIYLDYDPIDWKDLKITYERDIVNFGIFRMFTLPTTWHDKAARILRTIFMEYGYEAYTVMKIEKLNTTNYTYEDLAVAEIDYTQLHSQFDIEGEPYTVKVNLMDNSIAEFIKANESMTETIELSSTNGAFPIVLDGIEQKNGCKWLVSDGLLSEGNINPAGGHCLNADILFIDAENKSDVHNVSWQRSNLITDFINSDKYIYKSTTNRTITFEWDITVHFGAVSGFNYSLGKSPVYVIQKWDGSSVTLLHTIHDFTGTSFLGNTHNITGTYSTTAQVGDEFYISVFVQPTPNANEFMNFNYDPASWITLKYYDRLPPTSTTVMRFYDVMNVLLKQQSGNKYSIVSDFLRSSIAVNFQDNEPFNTVLTPAESIKGKTGAKIKTSLDSLRKFTRSIWGAVWGIEGNKLRVEPLSYFFKKDSIITTIEAVGNFKWYVARDMLYSGVKVGYEKNTYDGVNGADEFNTLQEWKLPTNRVSNILDLVSPIRADIYGIEQQRLYRFTKVDEGLKETSSTKLDETLFAIEIEYSPEVRRWFGNYDFIETGTSTYNAGVSPKRGLIRNLPHIYSILPNQTDGEIKLTSTQNEGNLRTYLVSGEVINENTSMNVAGNPFAPASLLFKPIYFEFISDANKNIIAQILANPYGVIRFKVLHRGKPNGGNYYLKGFIVSVEAHPDKKDVYTWKLLSSPDNDLSVFNNV